MTFSQCSSVTVSAGRLASRDAGIVSEDIYLSVLGRELIRHLGDTAWNRLRP